MGERIAAVRALRIELRAAIRAVTERKKNEAASRHAAWRQTPSTPPLIN
jgi:hypothetical protein